MNRDDKLFPTGKALRDSAARASTSGLADHELVRIAGQDAEAVSAIHAAIQRRGRSAAVGADLVSDHLIELADYLEADASRI